MKLTVRQYFRERLRNGDSALVLWYNSYQPYPPLKEKYN